VSSAAYAYPAKSAEAFRTISEVASELDVPQHVLRFWESRFAQIKPVKRAGGRRYYRPDDVDLLKGIRALLYSDGFTIKGVQKVLKERGLRHVSEIGRGGVPSKPEPVVIEKIVYVEKPVEAPAPAPAKPRKARPTHLRAVPNAMSLPFFDMPEETPSREFPVLDTAPVVEETVVEVSVAEMPVIEEPVVIAEPEIADDLPPAEPAMAVEDRERLEALLDELTGLKGRLQSARGA
jgi:DNA-binding transcriptional MerR regulator